MTVGGLAPVTYGYNAADQLTSVAQGSATASLAYDGAGRPRTVTLPDGIVETYSYDDASELTGITYTSGSTTLGDLFYGYDQAGRRKAAWGGFARTGLPAATTQAASYNANNQLTAWNGTSLTYDPNGNVTAFGSQTLAWNDRNQLASTSGGAASFAYDGVGRRVRKTVDGPTTKYLYDGENVVQEQDSAGAATATLLTGLGIDQVFSRTDSAGARSFLTDALGSIIALADPSGAITTSYTYEPFGAVTASGAANTNGLQFTGRENDGASGLSFYRARYYSPTLGRFISEDPLGFPGGPDPNVYAYVWNNPVGLVDSFGLDPGNGCGFLPFGCLARFFGNIFSSVSATVLGWVPSLGEVFSGLQVFGRFVGDAAGWIGLGAAILSFAFPGLAPIALGAVWVQIGGFGLASVAGILQGDVEGALYDFARMSLASLAGTVASSSQALRPPLKALERGILTGVNSSFDLLLNLCGQDSDCYGR